MEAKARRPLGTFIQHVMAILLLVIGCGLCWLGSQLAWLGGSPYYLIAGLLVIASAWLQWRGSGRAAVLYGVMLLGTWLWALWEVGFDGWPLTARVLAPTVLGCWFLTPWAYRADASPAKRLRGGAAVALALALIAVAAIGYLSDRVSAPATTPAEAGAAAASDDGDWQVWGRNLAGDRFSPLAQITPQNVNRLEKIWEFRTGSKAGPDQHGQFEATPLKIRDTLYLCTPDSEVIALDAETGKQRWRFNPRADLRNVAFTACRGVAYYRTAVGLDAACAERIISTTVDGRLLAVDARNGRLCEGFGKGGMVDIKVGMGMPGPAYYYVTSAPAIVRGKIIFGGFVPDNQRIDSPSGVIRAFDATTGAFAWAFDVGRPDNHAMPPPGQSFTPNTPNSWAPISGDEALGLVYLPTGNSVPDWFGGQRRPFDEKFSSAVVALEADTGKLRWSFQTTHHDIWDYDVPAQPTLYNMPVGNRIVPALIQPTKRGEIFVLDRRTGRPITPVEERRVPQTTVPGERTAPRQPFSVGMPDFAGPRLTERMMWGLTPLDQAWCRLAFRQSVYEGPLTPVRVKQPTIVYPGYNGGSDWGAIAIDVQRGILVGNSIRFALRAHLIPRSEADRLGLKPMGDGVHGDLGGLGPQAGTPYAVSILPFLSPLQVPCQQPPWGLLSAIDLKTRKLLWSEPLGSGREGGPWGLRSRLPYRMGVPHVGGPMVTRSGLTFLGASQDRFFRAFETRTGRLLWQSRLPAGGHANPMTYLTPSGRQVVVIAAGGHSLLRSGSGDYVMAYALPRRAR